MFCLNCDNDEYITKVVNIFKAPWFRFLEKNGKFNVLRDSDSSNSKFCRCLYVDLRKVFEQSNQSFCVVFSCGILT